MSPARRYGLFIAAGLGAMLALPGAASAKGQAAGAPPSLTCSGGDFSTFAPELIPSGTYASIKVTGFCEVASGATVRVLSGLDVAPSGFLVASGALDNAMDHPDCNRTMSVSGGVRVGAKGVLILGDGPGSGCVVNTATTVNGGIDATGALDLIVHGVTVNGGVTSIGGGDNLPCDFSGLPTYSTIEDSHVNGGVTVSGYRACWLGFARNHISGGATLTDNKLDDPDAMEILANAIHGRLACSGNSPTPTNIADGVTSEPNTVTGKESGQCAGL